MDEYISREFVLSCVDSFLSKTDMPIAAQYFYDCLRECEAADVQSVKHGRWIEVTPKHSRCSVCDTTCLIAVSPISKGANYCPNCGAIMDLKEGEKNV